MSSPVLQRIRTPTLWKSLAAGTIAAGVVARYTMSSQQQQTSQSQWTIRADSTPSTQPQQAQRVFGRAGPAFVKLPLESSEMVNHNTKRLRFRLPRGESSCSGLGLTSSLLTLSWPQGSWLPCARPYTPVSPSDAKGFIEFLVKKYPSGKQSGNLHSLQPGDAILFAAALPGYNWKPNAFKHITLIAGGAGITPIYQLAQGILRNPDDKTSMTLVFGVNSEQDVLLRKEFQTWESQFPDRFQAVYTVSKPAEAGADGAAGGFRKGYVDRQLLEQVIPDKYRGRGEETKVFVCGPPAMETALVGGRKDLGILQQVGFRKDQIYRF